MFRDDGRDADALVKVVSGGVVARSPVDFDGLASAEQAEAAGAKESASGPSPVTCESSRDFVSDLFACQHDNAMKCPFSHEWSNNFC